MHWAAQYIGKPHVPGARGPDAYDCWGLLRAAYLMQFNIYLPSLPGISSQTALVIHRQLTDAANEEWEEIDDPFDGCAVAMSQSKAYHHVGLYIAEGPGKVLHCWDGANVIIEKASQLKLRGLKRITYYRHKLWPTS